MMTTRERAEALASAAKAFAFLGKTTAEDLMELIAAELGHADALDSFVPRGKHVARAIARDPILHIVAGNTPAAALQTAIRGLLIGAHNRIKLPSAGLAEMDEFHSRLPADLARKCELAHDMPEEWLNGARAIVVFGTDETIAEIHKRVRPEQVFLTYGHRISFGAILEDTGFRSAADAARDVSLFDQLGCLSPQVLYVQDEPRHYAERLAAAMADWDAEQPSHGRSLSTANAIRSLREEIAFRAANGEECAVWASAGSTAWTVIYDAAASFPNSPLHRTIFVKPLTRLRGDLEPIRRHLSCASIYPASIEYAHTLMETGVSRICPVGQMQSPPWTWHQDGHSPLGALVRWVDVEA